MDANTANKPMPSHDAANDDPPANEEEAIDETGDSMSPLLLSQSSTADGGVVQLMMKHRLHLPPIQELEMYVMDGLAQEQSADNLLNILPGIYIHQLIIRIIIFFLSFDYLLIIF